MVLRAIAVIGLIAILLLGAWGIIQIAFALPDVLSNLGLPGGNSSTATSTTQGRSSLVVSVPSIVTSGEPFALSWKDSANNGQHGYAVSYSCASGLTVKAPLPTGALQAVPCNTPFNFTNASQTMTLTPSIIGRQQVAVTFIVAAANLANGAILATAGGSTTVLPTASASVAATQPAAVAAAQAQPVAATTPSTTYVTTTARPVLYGLPNLGVSIISATPSASSYQSTHYTMQFVVQNTGTNVAPAGWTFAATLPTNPSYVYQSPAQQALRPGDKIVFTLGFDIQNTAAYNNAYYQQNTNCVNNAYAYTSTYSYTHQNYYDCPATNNWYSNSNNAYQNTNHVFSVTVDPQHYISEQSEGNNTASITL